jgi:hypothetical protein
MDGEPYGMWEWSELCGMGRGSKEVRVSAYAASTAEHH